MGSQIMVLTGAHGEIQGFLSRRFCKSTLLWCLINMNKDKIPHYRTFNKTSMTWSKDHRFIVDKHFFHVFTALFKVGGLRGWSQLLSPSVLELSCKCNKMWNLKEMKTQKLTILQIWNNCDVTAPCKSGRLTGRHDTRLWQNVSDTQVFAFLKKIKCRLS